MVIIVELSMVEIQKNIKINCKLEINYTYITSQNCEDSLGYFNCELLTSNGFLYFNDKKKLLIFNSIFEISSKIFPERQSFNKIYNSLDNLINNFDEDPLKKFVLWEYDTLCDLGYGYDDQDNIKSYIPSLLLDRKSDYIFNDLKNILDINKNIYDKQFHDKYSNSIIETC